MIVQIPMGKMTPNEVRAAAEKIAKAANSFGTSLCGDQAETTGEAVCDFCGNRFETAAPKKCPICGTKQAKFWKEWG